MKDYKFDIEKDLDYYISEKAKINLIKAKIWQWKIENEYSKKIRELVYAWVKDESLPYTEYNNVSIKMILENTHLDFLDAIELLHILSIDPPNGYMIYMQSIGKGRRGFRL